MTHYSNQDQYEREPLDPAYNARYDTPSRQPAHHTDEYSQAPSPYYDNSPSARPEPYTPHFEQSRYDNMPQAQDGPPPPPPHGALHPNTHSNPSASASAHQHSQEAYRGGPSSLPGPDHLGPAAAAAAAAAGGRAGMPHNAATDHDSFPTTGQVLPPPSRAQYPNSARSVPSPRHSVHSGPYAGGYAIDRDSRSSVNPFGTVASSSVASRSPSRSPHVPGDPYGGPEEGYYNYSATARRDGPALGMVDPMSIADDGDDGLEYGRRSHRNSATPSSSRHAGPAAIGAAAGGATAVAAEYGKALLLPYSHNPLLIPTYPMQLGINMATPQTPAATTSPPNENAPRTGWIRNRPSPKSGSGPLSYSSASLLSEPLSVVLSEPW